MWLQRHDAFRSKHLQCLPERGAGNGKALAKDHLLNFLAGGERTGAAQPAQWFDEFVMQRSSRDRLRRQEGAHDFLAHYVRFPQCAPSQPTFRKRNEGEKRSVVASLTLVMHNAKFKS